MTINPAFPLQANAELPELPFAAVRQAVIAMAQEHELPVIENSAAAVTVEIAGFGHYRFAARNGSTAISVSAAMPDRLHMLKDGIAAHLDEIQPGTSDALRWPDATAAGALPPNVHFTMVQSVTPVGRAFLRVQVKSPDLAGFQDDAIHFRLLLPPAGCTAPEWPRLSETGATVWPKGETALHRPVYTTRRICHEAGLMEFDIFLHDGGRATDWARQAAPGTSWPSPGLAAAAFRQPRKSCFMPTKPPCPPRPAFWKACRGTPRARPFCSAPRARTAAIR